MTRRYLITALAVAAFAAGGVSAIGAAGPSPGVSAGSSGITALNGQVHYVALVGEGETALAVIRGRDGRVLRYTSIFGSYGIPLVAYDGTTDGLSRDGRSLVLATFAGADSATAFAIVDTKKLRVRQRVTLDGSWSFDALSPDARTMFLIQYLSTQNAIRYRVRAFDLSSSRLLPGAIVDKSEPKEPMTGSPITRAASSDGTWAYTLYQRAGKEPPFIHALDTQHRRAVCLDLAWKGSQDSLSRIRIVLSRNQKTILLRDRASGRTVMTVAAPR